MGFRLIVGSDEAGYDYKEIIKADLEASGRVDSVVDVGVVRDARASYPIAATRPPFRRQTSSYRTRASAVRPVAARRRASTRSRPPSGSPTGRQTVPSSSAAPDSASRSRRTRCAASAL